MVKSVARLAADGIPSRAVGTLAPYGLMSDDALCGAASRGDRRASETLLKRHDKWIRACALKWKIPGFEREDVYATALVGAVRAIEQFDAERGVKFVTFMWFCIRTECEHTFARERRRRTIGDTISLSVATNADLVDSTAAADTRTLEETLVDGLEADRLRDAVFATQRGPQAARNRIVLSRLMDGWGVSEAGADFGMSPQNVNGVRERVRRPFEAAQAPYS